jgi:predicted metal-dependent hydrolase
MAKKIRIKNGEGKFLEVYEKAYEVVYKNAGFYPVKENEDKENEKEISEMTEEELKNATKDELKAYLDELEIEYKSNATKDELISLIVGE